MLRYYHISAALVMYDVHLSSMAIRQQLPKRLGRPISMLQRVLTQDPGTISACFAASRMAQLSGTGSQSWSSIPPTYLHIARDYLTIHAAELYHEWRVVVKAPSSSYAPTGRLRHDPERFDQTIEAQDHHLMPGDDQEIQVHNFRYLMMILMRLLRRMKQMSPRVALQTHTNNPFTMLTSVHSAACSRTKLPRR